MILTNVGNYLVPPSGGVGVFLPTANLKAGFKTYLLWKVKSELQLSETISRLLEIVPESNNTDLISVIFFFEIPLQIGRG